MQRLSFRVAAAAARTLVLSLVCLSALAKDKIAEHGETVYLARDFIFVDAPAIEGYLQAICKRLLDAKGVSLATPPKIFVQSSDAFNAFTDATGHLVISTGALRAMESEDELAALLGHELSHLILKHPQGKDAMSSLPLGVETMSSVQDATAELKGQRVSANRDLTALNADSLSNTQASSLLWSDFIAPSWNRTQEREADEKGFELMRAAGYDPSTFGQLFAKLQAAEVQRSQRLQVLKKSLVVRLRQAGSKVAASSGRSETVALTSEVKGALADDAAERLVDGISAFNRAYESPDERQTALANYAREHRAPSRIPHPTTQFKDVLQGGEGGSLLTLDGAAIVTMNALASRNTAVAKLAVQSLGTEDAQLPSAHLHLAIGSYNELYGDREVGERAAEVWMASLRAPAQAFSWVASHKAKRGDYNGAIETLETGRRRVGASTPFLPTLVAMARASGNLPLARDYTKECQAESNQEFGDRLHSLVSEPSAPKGLYAECVRALGEKPTGDVVAESVTNTARDLGKKLFQKK
jgi:Zn-dependent protease with chaperone function